MRWFKLGIVVIILALVALFIYQNMPTFEQDLPFNYNLHVTDKVEWTHSVSALIFMSAGLGFIIGILIMLKPYMSARRLLSQERKSSKQASSGNESAPTDAAKPTAG